TVANQVIGAAVDRGRARDGGGAAQGEAARRLEKVAVNRAAEVYASLVDDLGGDRARAAEESVGKIADVAATQCATGQVNGSEVRNDRATEGRRAERE